MTFRPCGVVPTHNHSAVIGAVVASLRSLGLPVFVIDDGSQSPHREVIARLHAPDEGVVVYRRDQNGGKGAAVVQGLRLAQDHGYSHAVQVDADGQHDGQALPQMLALAQAEPDALISGEPIYDETIPKGRKIGRYFTHFWVWIETLSFQISDSMCGFRVYPCAASVALLDEEDVGLRMDFDTEIMVRLYWRGTPVRMTPVRVHYPKDNTSNFDLVADNWRITKMHTRLVFTMLWRLPRLLAARKRHRSRPWASVNERGMAWGLAFLARTYRLLGYRGCWAVMQPILLYFFLTGAAQRRASGLYWQKMNRALGRQGQSGWRQQWRHIRAFGQMALDKFAAWMGDIKVADLEIHNQAELDRVIDDKQGVLVIASHLGNIEICRALSDRHGQVKMTVFAHTKHAVHFNALLAQYNPKAAIDVVEVDDMGPATAVDLQERLAGGEWVVIAGDRTPVSGQKRRSLLPFLGQEAPFSQGPILLAHLLQCPVYAMTCLRDGKRFQVHFDRLFDQVSLGRTNRAASIEAYQGQYVALLEGYAKQYPLQWFNFFDFWEECA